MWTHVGSIRCISMVYWCNVSLAKFPWCVVFRFKKTKNISVIRPENAVKTLICTVGEYYSSIFWHTKFSSGQVPLCTFAL